MILEVKGLGPLTPAAQAPRLVCDCLVLIAAGPAMDGVTVWRETGSLWPLQSEVQGVLKPVVAITLQTMPW